MPSISHEGPLDLVRQCPEIAVELVQGTPGVKLPGEVTAALAPIVIDSGGPPGRDGAGGPFLTVFAASMGGIDMTTEAGARRVLDAMAGPGVSDADRLRMVTIILRLAPDAARQRLEAIHEELRVLSYAGNPDRFHEVNERFHNAIYAGSQNDYIAEMTLATRVRVQPFRRAQFRNLGRLAKSHAEHDRVVVAIMRGDRVGASVAMRAHIELVRGEYELYAVSV